MTNWFKDGGVEEISGGKIFDMSGDLNKEFRPLVKEICGYIIEKEREEKVVETIGIQGWLEATVLSIIGVLYTHGKIAIPSLDKKYKKS